MKIYILLALLSLGIEAESALRIYDKNTDDNIKIFEMIADIADRNLRRNGWNNVFFAGKMEDILFMKLRHLDLTFTITDSDTKLVHMRNSDSYKSNTIIMQCESLITFQSTINKTITSSYWHSHANIILYYTNPYDKHVLAKIFYSLWHHKAVNAIIVHKKGGKLLISHYNPYHPFAHDISYGCWNTNFHNNYDKDTVCVENRCDVSLKSIIREKHLGTCIGLSTFNVSFGDYQNLHKLNLFEDKGRNMHGFTLRAYNDKMLSFLKVNKQLNDNPLTGIDEVIWTTISKLMNFTIRVLPFRNKTNDVIPYTEVIRQLNYFRQRKVDLILFPVYLLDTLIESGDFTFPFVDSGLCFISHKAGLENTLFGMNFIKNNYNIIIEYFVCFFCICLILFLFSYDKIGKYSYNQAGKDFINAYRIALSISISTMPRRKSFRIFFAITTWGFFIINFMVQAVAISIYSTFTLGKNIDTFDDVIENIQQHNKVVDGMNLLDMPLAKGDEKLDIIYSNMRQEFDMFECVKHLKNDANLICVTDCTIGNYLERSEINEKGEQYLYIAKNNKIYSFYLNMLLPRHSPMTEHFNRYIMALVEAGIIKYWMEFKHKNTRNEIPINVLSMKDLAGFFCICCVYIGICIIVFIFEVILGKINKLINP